MAGEAIGEAYVRIRPETSTFRGETTHALTRDLKATERELGRFTRGAALGSGALHGLGRGVIYASNTIIGGYGLVYAVRKSTEAAKDAQVTQGQLTTAVRSAGIQYNLYRGEINRALKATQELGFSSDDTARSYTTLIRATGDVTRATRDQELAANIARATNTSLAQASKAVAQAEAGRTGALQRLLPGLQKTTSAEKALEQATRITAGSAARYANSFAGSQERLNAAISETEVTIGRALIPKITDLSGRLADWLDDSRNQKRIQDDVNEAVKTAGAGIRTLTDLFNGIKGPIKEVNRLLGGSEDTLKVLGGLYVLKRLGLLKLAIKAIGTAEKATTAVVVEQSAIQATAISSVGVAAGGTATKVGLLRGALLRSSRVAPLVAPLAIGYAGKKYLDWIAAGLPGAPTPGQGGPENAGMEWWATAAAKANPAHSAEWYREHGSVAVAVLKQAGVIKPTLGARRSGVTLPGSVSGSVLTGLTGLNAMQRNSLALSAAGRTATQSDDLAALRVQRGLLGKAIATETQRLKTAPNARAAAKYAENLQALEAQDASAFSAIQSIEEQAASAARERAARIKAAAAARARAEKEAQAAIDRANAERFANLLSNANEQIKAYAAITKRREALQKSIEREGARAVGGAAKSVFGSLGHVFGNSGKGAADIFTLAQLYQEAESEFKLYGSNYGPRGTTLSPQQQRASYSNTVLKQRGNVTVIQNFHAATKASQAMNDARSGVRYLN